MITMLVHRYHRYTVRAIRRTIKGVKVRTMNYDQLLRKKSIPAGTYIFTDLDRLNDWESHLAADVYRLIIRAGPAFQALNDPARFKNRYSLLRTLYAKGINQFNIYRADGTERPGRFPVFVRMESDHRYLFPQLLHTQEELETKIEALKSEGYPERALVVIEYCAQEITPGLYRKLAVFRIGDEYVAPNCVHDTKWAVKRGAVGIATQELYEDDFRIVRDNPWKEAMQEIFSIAGLDYGRCDFGLVDGKPQIYEINSNPSMKPLKSHPIPLRLQAAELFWKKFLDAMSKQDLPSSRERLSLNTEGLREYRQRVPFFARACYRP